MKADQDGRPYPGIVGRCAENLDAIASVPGARPRRGPGVPAREGPDAAAAAERAAHRRALEVERLRSDGILGHAALARALTERGVPTPRGGATWTHATVARILRAAGVIPGG